MNINSGNAKLVLLCPAWKNRSAAKTVRPDTVILHSRADNVIPFADSEELARNLGATLIEVGSDHRLADLEALAAVLRACGEKIVGSDFGVPASAGQQSKKIILIEAVRLGERCYSVGLTGRNERLVREPDSKGGWQASRRGWTVPELSGSLASDPAVTVAAFDFPFSLPMTLLTSPDFSQLVGQPVFGSRSAWAQFVSESLRLQFATTLAKSKLEDLAKFQKWRDERFWQRRATDEATGGSPPLKHKYQNIFSMTLAGTAMLEQLARHGVSPALSNAAMPSNGRVAFETYPSAVADRCGFKGSYKKEPEKCLQKAEAYLAANRITLDFAKPVRDFCLAYRTAGKSKSDPDPDGADAFLCLVAAICFREGIVELCSGNAAQSVLAQEGCIIAPVRLQPCPAQPLK
jgi:hypothetical protein